MTWTRAEGGPSSRGEAALGFLTSAFVVSPVLFCLGFALPELLGAALSPGGTAAWIAVFALATLGYPLFRWTTRQLAGIWGTRWMYMARDGSRWGTIHTLFGWYTAGEGVCLTGFEVTAAGRTPLSSVDALGADVSAVASALADLQSGREPRALGAFDALMLATLAGLTARGTATISRARELRWHKEWLRKPRRDAPQRTFTIERSHNQDDGGDVERCILSALQAAEERLIPEDDEEQPQSYRNPARATRHVVRLRLDGELLAPAFATASDAMTIPANGGAPIAVAVAINDFGQRDPERMAYLCGLLATHQPQ
ncbi:hypothetical protein [Chondromyces apiculatus]|uniref:Uncharacterized protein n=1 Tax=Chondromyces apiculatus DSM 436 TaxID=1192034 RepID=A0A017TIF5_9BACT|nr:hypothetical protein [Chondromyces apiculatus]EYF08620.1 Hypothetical protein CAP_4150 [Chondromyces apiculatus DSM 436]